ncbi:uncharacterized protein LOC121426410 [Lytechinus variegatus]|uniref:uncharacterized protein LOC121426410 n=1 Tax=Lytechinus variegatus TaxID=7654 RepID=UPI001BB20D1D|nr:uncharacterized protein LOC121426410 [Lytechinus variegatus]
MYSRKSFHLSVLSSSLLLALIFITAHGTSDGGCTRIDLIAGVVRNLTSPNYPTYYANDLTLNWCVQAPSSQRILVTFINFSTEIGDILTIKEEKYRFISLKYIGNKEIPPIHSFGNRLFISFKSDESGSGMGFVLSLSSVIQTGPKSTVAFEGSDHIRILNRTMCNEKWDIDVADTICREAGFPGSYETSWGGDSTTMSNGTSYTCNENTHHLEDCNSSTSLCSNTFNSVIVTCKVLNELGCFNLTEYTGLMSRSEQLGRDQCFTHCRTLSTPQYAVHRNRSDCTCITQTKLNVSRLIQSRDVCRNNMKRIEYWAYLFNATNGFCGDPPKIADGSWYYTMNGFLYGTTITAKCDENYELIDGDGRMRCEESPTTQDFEWHGTIPSCRMKNTGTTPDGSLSVSATASMFTEPTSNMMNGAAHSTCVMPLMINAKIGK